MFVLSCIYIILANKWCFECFMKILWSSWFNAFKSVISPKTNEVSYIYWPVSPAWKKKGSRLFISEGSDKASWKYQIDLPVSSRPTYSNKLFKLEKTDIKCGNIISHLSFFFSVMVPRHLLESTHLTHGSVILSLLLLWIACTMQTVTCLVFSIAFWQHGCEL